MNTKFIAKSFSFLTIITFSVMNPANAAKILIKNENIPTYVTYKGQNHKVDAIKVAFINEKSKQSSLYTLSPMEIPLYQSITTTLPQGNYEKISVSLQLKKAVEVTHFCAVDHGKALSLNGKTILHLGISYEENGLECTLASYENPEVAS